MNHNLTPVRLSALIAATEHGDLRKAIESLTSVTIELPLETLLGPLLLPFDVVDPIMTRIWDLHDDAVTAAFTAGLACGLNPGLLLFELTPAQDDAAVQS